jgi:hypothetical protein
MFLIEFTKDQFIDAERINYVGLHNNKVTFTFAGESERAYTVDKIMETKFLDHLQVINSNIAAGSPHLAGRHCHINNPDTKY